MSNTNIKKNQSAFMHQRSYQMVVLLLAFNLSGLFAQGLSSLATNTGINFGTMVTKKHFRTNPDGYKSILVNEFNMVFPENEIKYYNIEPSRGVFNYSYPDSVIAFARANGKKTRGHFLIWHSFNQIPKWITDRWSGPNRWSRAELLSIMKTHIEAVVGHYKGKITEWDVINEGIAIGDGHPYGLRKSPWQQIIGDDYIDSAFVWAHRADPGAYLYFNEYGAEGAWSGEYAKRDTVYNLMKRLLARGVPVHGVGFESHFGDYINTGAISANIKKLGELGLRVSLTETDMMHTTNLPNNWKNLMNAALANYNCTSFVTWGVDDMSSWNGSDCGCLVWETLSKPKTAIYTALSDALKAANPDITAQRKAFSAQKPGTEHLAHPVATDVDLSVVPKSNHTQIIIDNTDAECTFDELTSPQWAVSTHTPGWYGTNYVLDGNERLDIDRWAKWTPTISQAGKYKVFMRWVAGTNRPMHAPVEIKHANGSANLLIDQTINGSMWVYLGTYSLSAGSQNYVKLTTANPGYTCADAVMFERLDNQTITFNALPDKTYGDDAFTVSPSSSSALSVTLKSTNTSVATVSGRTITIVGAGTTSIIASQAGNSDYQPASSVTRTLVVDKANQSILFSNVSAKNTGIADYYPEATLSSDLPITYTSSNTGVATIVNGKIHIVGSGYAAITASQAGNDNYNAAASVTQHLYVNRVNMNKTATASNVYSNSSDYSSDKAFDGNMNTRWATDDTETSAWLEIDLGASYAISKASYCEYASRVSGFNIEYWNGFVWKTAFTGTTIGTSMKTNQFSEVIGSKVRLNITDISASSGPTIWEFAVYGTPKKATQNITFNDLVERTFGLTSSFDLDAISSSGLPVSYTSSNADVATISGNTVTVVGVGTTTITASQGGNLNFNAATLVAQELKINASKPFANNAIPGVVEAENYDYGWEGYAYHDATPTNTGGAYRNDGVDLSECTDAGGGYQIQTTAAGEWVKYTVDVATSGNYVISTRCRAGNAGTTFRIEVDGVNKTGTLTVPNTSYGAWSNITDTINLTAGRHILRVYIISNIIHFNKFTFTSVSALKSMPLTGIVSPESADSYLTLSPNPLSGNSLTISYNLTVESNVRVAIYNLAGTVIYKTNLGERTAGDKNETLLLPSLPKGTYIVRIVTANGSRTEKLIHL